MDKHLLAAAVAGAMQALVECDIDRVRAKLAAATKPQWRTLWSRRLQFLLEVRDRLVSQ